MWRSLSAVLGSGAAAPKNRDGLKPDRAAARIMQDGWQRRHGNRKTTRRQAACNALFLQQQQTAYKLIEGC
jgi:hypothetical protein